MKKFNKLTIDQVKQEISKTSVVEVIQKAIDSAKADDYNSVISLTETRALERAAKIQKQLNEDKDVGRLAGIPFVAKDNYLTFDTETTASSNILKGFKAPYQATTIEKLESEGAIMIGKANLDAFAHGSSTENSDFGPTLNPHDKTRVPGGSSGGSAAAVALKLAPFALGSDTGGSIRLPASYCGVVGYKPTYGITSRWGVIAMGSSTDVMGPLANTVEDAALVLDVMAGKDQRDSTMIDRDDDYTQLKPKDGLKVGVIKEYLQGQLNPKVKKLIQESIKKLKSEGAAVEEISLPAVKQALACYYVIVPAEVSSNLARYDGVRFGFSDKTSKNLEETYTSSRSQGFGDEAKRRIMIGNYVLSSGYYDAYYKKAMQVRTLLVKQFNEAFKEFDVLVGPVAPDVAFKLGENTEDLLQMYLTDVMTVGVSLVGAPAVSVPAGEVDGLPVGFQIIGQQGADKLVLSVARQFQEANSG